MKKCEQAIKDAEFYHAEAESLRGRCNEILIEKQRYEQEVNSLRIFGKSELIVFKLIWWKKNFFLHVFFSFTVDEERKEMAELRRQQQDVLNAAEGGKLTNALLK